jgi:hypothetical protein
LFANGVLTKKFSTFPVFKLKFTCRKRPTMPGTILENLSGRKLSVLVVILLLIQVGCFLVGLIGPRPATSQGIIATTCLDNASTTFNPNHWITLDCNKINLNNLKPGVTAENIVSPQFYLMIL